MTNFDKLTKVESSNVEAIGYENGELFVKYKGGTLYKYKSVPADIHEALVKAESKGRFMNESIKGKYEYEKVDLK